MDFLKVKGRNIVDTTGKEIRLRGTCIGGWMNMENFIDGYPGCESGLRRAMKEILGEENGRYFFESLLDNFFTEADVEYLRGVGANAIRLPLNYRHFEDDDNPFVYKEEGFRRLFKALDWCEKYNVYVILDMHAVQGWQNAHWHSDNENAVSLFWQHKQFQERLAGLWRELARRCKGRAVVAGYELMNEPIVNTPAGDLPHMYYENYRPKWDLMNRVYRELCASIREIDPDHIIVLEGDRYGHLFDGLDAPFADNLVYSSHNYTLAGFGPGKYPGEFNAYRTDQAEISGLWDRARQDRIFRGSPGAKFAEKYGVPLLAGEFGSQYNTGAADLPYRIAAMDDQLGVFNDWGAHWTTWTFKDMGVMGWVTVDPRSEYARLVAPIQKKKTQLGAENFVGWYTDPPGKQVNRMLARTIADVIGDPGLSPVSNASCLSVFTLTGYAAACLQPEYCRRFKGMGKADIDRVMESFALKNCVVNEPYRKILVKNLL
ncbi:MAG: glycoside hydrolase family 5 protein [Treponema sp.]|nr:glycoside hydrolase family 5 protein [Treponema sp.]